MLIAQQGKIGSQQGKIGALQLYRAKQGNFWICPVATGQGLQNRAKTGRPVLSGQFGKYVIINIIVLV